MPKNSPIQPQTAELQALVDLKNPDSVLEALDRELDFYRKRAGQVFFFGLLVEGLILAGKEQVLLGNRWPWVRPITYTLMFIAVAAIGTTLGSEYRARIHTLKDSRLRLLKDLKHHNVYPADRRISEIKVMYVVLWFLSSVGVILVWLAFIGNGYTNVMTR